MLRNDWLPDELGDLEDKLDVGLRGFRRRSPHLTHDHTDGIVEPPITLMIAVVPGGTYLPPTDRVGTAITLLVENDVCSVIGLDNALKIHAEGPVGSPPGMVGSPKSSRQLPLAAPGSEQEQFLFLTSNYCARSLFRVAEP